MIDLSGEPRCLTISDDGRIYVGMKDHVEVLDAQGKPVASWEPLGDEAVLTSIARHKDDVFVADAGHRIVLHYDTAGTLVGHIGEKDPDRTSRALSFPVPHFDLAVSRDGLLRVADPGRNRIETFTLDGDLEFSWGERSVGIKGFCGCCNPVSFALLPDGGFVTAEKGLVRVKVYNSDGGLRGRGRRSRPIRRRQADEGLRDAGGVPGGGLGCGRRARMVESTSWIRTDNTVRGVSQEGGGPVNELF